MPSYVVTGASRGIGYEFIRHLSKDPSNTVIGLVRNKATTEDRLAKDGIKNVTILEADITDFDAQQRAAVETGKLTGGSLDCLINNAALVASKSAIMDMGDFENDVELLDKELVDHFNVNVVGVTKTITAFLPLIKQGKMKKVINISTGLADLDASNDLAFTLSPAYSVSKAALNLLVSKYSAFYSTFGILFMSISPGLVDTSEGKQPSPEELKKLGPMFEAFQKYKPDFTGPITTQESVEKVMAVVNGATVEKDGGSFVSHHGNKMWL